MPSKVSVAVLAATQFDRDRVSRLRGPRQYADRVVRSGLDLVVAHAHRGQRIDEQWLEYLRSQRVVHVTIDDRDRMVRESALLDAAAHVADAEQLLFMRSDITLPHGVLTALTETVRADGTGVMVAPEVVLSAGGMASFLRDPNPERLERAFYDFSDHGILKISMATSTVVIEREAYLRHGPLEPTFESTDPAIQLLALRVAKESGRWPVPRDLADLGEVRSPAFATGYRAFMMLFSLPLFLRGIFVVRSGRASMSQDDQACLSDRLAALTVGPPQAPPLLFPLSQDGRIDATLAVNQMVRDFGQATRDHSALFDNRPLSAEPLSAQAIQRAGQHVWAAAAGLREVIKERTHRRRPR